VAVGVPEEGATLPLIGLIQVLYGILGYWPMIVVEKNGFYDIKRHLDLYELMDDARQVRV